MTKVLSPRDFTKNEIRNALFHILASAPGSPVEAQYYYNSTDKTIEYYDGADFQVVATVADLVDGYQPLDSDLTAIAALSPTNDDILQRKAGAWTNRTAAQLKTDLALVKGDVGLGNVDNTSDASKPVSTAQQAALDLKANLASPALTGTPAAPTAAPGTNTTQIATTAFTIAEIAARLATADALRYVGAIDASGEPNYPAADAGDTYRISVAGEIGGDMGEKVEAGDLIICHVDSSPGGDQATVGADWDIIQTNIHGAVTEEGSQTLLNKSISAGDNTITGIGVDEVVADIITGQTELATVAGDDKILISDTSAAGALRWMSRANFVAGLSGSLVKYSALIGNGSATAITVTQATHGAAASRANLVQLLEESTGEVVEADISVASNGDVTLTFAVAPASNAVRVTIIG